MALSYYDKEFLNPEQKDKVLASTDLYNKASSYNDPLGMRMASEQAAKVRSDAGYSSGYYGNQLSGWQATQDPRNQGNYGDKLNTGLTTMERYNRYKDPYANDVRVL